MFEKLLSCVLVLLVLLAMIGEGYRLGADTACQSAKECPSDFKAKWVERGCLCIPRGAP